MNWRGEKNNGVLADICVLLCRPHTAGVALLSLKLEAQCGPGLESVMNTYLAC